MFFKRNQFDNLTTSRLVYHFTFSENGSFDLDEVKDNLLKRLNKVYKLDEETSKKFIAIEQEKFASRGDTLTNYLFGEPKSVEDILKTFYDCENKIYSTMPVKDHFNDLTFSELALLHSLFQTFKLNFQLRELKLLKAEKKENNKEKSEVLLDRVHEERRMEKYYELLRKCMVAKMLEILQYKDLSDNQKLVLLSKELKYAKDRMKGYGDFFKKYSDLSFDVISDERKIVENFGADVYVFKK